MQLINFLKIFHHKCMKFQMGGSMPNPASSMSTPASRMTNGYSQMIQQKRKDNVPYPQQLNLTTEITELKQKLAPLPISIQQQVIQAFNQKVMQLLPQLMTNVDVNNAQQLAQVREQAIIHAKAELLDDPQFKSYNLIKYLS